MSNHPSHIVADVVQQLMVATTLPYITRVVADGARRIAGADGATFVMRDGDKCFYMDENAISPLWMGRRFPIETCISGWSMLHRKTVLIEDIYVDGRIPHDAYRATFVKSLCIVPIRVEKPLGAIGTYWKEEYAPAPEEVQMLEIIANNAAIAWENLQLKQNVIKAGMEHNALTDHNKEVESAMYALAHDLRSPLSTMILLADLVQSTLPAPRDSRLNGLLDTIKQTGYQASDQINSMLALYSTSGRQIRKERVNLSALIAEAVEHMKAKEAGRQIRFEVEGDLTVYADPVLLRIAVENLLSNAVKYTGKKPSALIEFRRAPQENANPTFYVRDNGDGFDPSQAPLLFRPLVRLHDESEFRGTGLGLASVARIIELHGGRVRAEGRKGEGATFYFSIPENTKAN